MFGCESLAAVRPSRLKRELTSGASRSGSSTLIATGRSRTSSLPRNTVDMPPEPISRTSANLPPSRLTAALRSATAPGLDDLPAHGAREGLEGLLEAEQGLNRQRLLPVAQRLLRIVVRLHDEPVRFGSDGGFGERNHEVAPARGVGGIHDHRQVGEALGHDDRGEVEREPRGGLEGADAPLAEHDVIPARARHVLGGQEPLLHGRGEPALEENAAVRARYRRSNASEQRKVSRVARPDLEDLRVLHNQVDVVGVHDLGDYLEPERTGYLGHDLEPLLAEALEGVGGGARLEGAA